MADLVPGADESQRGIRRWRRGWYPYDAYQDVHQSHIEALYREGLLVRDTLTFREIRTASEFVKVQVRGRVQLTSGAVVVVNKWLDVRRGRQNRVEVRGRHYSYHAWARNPRRDLFRYDDAHGQLHRHVYDQSGREIRVEPLDLDQLPRLDLLVREAARLGPSPGSISEGTSGH